MCHFAPPPVSRKYNRQYESKPAAGCTSRMQPLVGAQQALQNSRIERRIRGAAAEKSRRPSATPRSHAKPRRAAAPPRPTASGPPASATSAAAAGIMARHQEELVARDAPHGFRMPAAQRGAAAVPGDAPPARTTRPDSAGGAAQAEIHILQIRFEALFQQPDAAEKIGAKQRGGPGRRQIRRGASEKAGPSGRPLPTRQAAPPRQITSKAPSSRPLRRASRILPVANQALAARIGRHAQVAARAASSAQRPAAWRNNRAPARRRYSAPPSTRRGSPRCRGSRPRRSRHCGPWR